MSIFSKKPEFSGWYDAPFPFGKTDFVLTIDAYDGSSGNITGHGEDKQGLFKIHGNIEDDGVIVKFVKDYNDNSHTGNFRIFGSFDWYLILAGIEYEGCLENDTITGYYSFQYKFFLISMNSRERFYMKVSKTQSLCGCHEECCLGCIGCMYCMGLYGCILCADCMDCEVGMICMGCMGLMLCDLLKPFWVKWQK